MNEIRILGPEGDVKKIWNPDVEVEVEDAKESFDRLTKNGYLAFKVDSAGEKAGKMSQFDPKAGKIILIPPIVGG